VTGVQTCALPIFLFAVLFSTLIGVLFGFGPANKAVRIPALDAIKNSE